MPLDLSSLTPYRATGAAVRGGAPTGAPSGTSSDLDLSGLVPYGSPQSDAVATGDNSASSATDLPPPQTDRMPDLGQVLQQAGYGLISGIPHAIEGTANMLETGTMEGLNNPLTGESLLSQFARDAGLSKAPAPPPKPYQPQSGNLIKSALNTVGLNPDAYLPAPQSGPERIARAVGEGVPLMLAPEAAAGRIEGLADALGAASTGAVSGGASQAAQETVPDQYKPLAAMAGAVAGGMGAGFIGKGAGTIADAARPLTKSGQEAMAGDFLANAASDPRGAVNAIDSSERELVSGSEPTTFQLTGDMGLGSLERAYAAQNPELFNAARADQNAARLDALTNIQDEGHPEAVADFFRDQMATSDQQLQNAYDQAQQSAASAANRIGSSIPPEAAGEQLRSALQAQLDAAKTNERQLWKAVDPNGTMTVLASPLKRAVQSIYGDMGPAAQLSVTPAEKGLAAVIDGYGATIPFNELTDVRSQISQTMRDAKSPLAPNDVAYGRLAQLRGAVENAISDSIQGKVAQEQQAVAAGAMSPDDTMFAKMANEQQEFYARRNQTAATGTGSGQSAVVNASRGPAAVPSSYGAEVQGGRGLSGDAGPQGLSQDAGSGPLVDQQAADRLATATNATRQRKQTFGAEPVNKILQRPGPSYDYKMPAGDIAAHVWRPGPQGSSAVSAVLKGAHNSPEAIDAIRVGAAASLRKAAMTADGTIDPDKFAAWKARHAEALDALEKVAPNSTAPYEDAAKAGVNLALIAHQRAAAIKAMQRSAIAKVANVDNPNDVTRSIGSIFGRRDAVQTMREVATAAKKDPVAFEGLRKAIIDHMTEKLVSNTEAATSGKNLIKSDQFQTFVGKNRAALAQVFSGKEIASMEAIARDLKRANRSIASTKIPGGSDTAQNLASMTKYAIEPTILNKLLEFGAWGGGGAGALIGHGLESGVTGALIGAGAGQVARWIGGLRAAGITHVNELVRDAMLNPDFAKTLLMKASKRAGRGSDATFARTLSRLALQGAALQGARTR